MFRALPGGRSSGTRFSYAHCCHSTFSRNLSLVLSYPDMGSGFLSWGPYRDFRSARCTSALGLGLNGVVQSLTVVSIWTQEYPGPQQFHKHSTLS